MGKFLPVGVALLLSLLAMPLGAVAKHAATSAATGAPEAAPTAPPGERKPLLEKVRENPKDYGDLPSDAHKDKDNNMRGNKLNPHTHPAPATIKNKVEHQTPAPAVPPHKVHNKKSLFQEIKDNPTKYNDARPFVDNKVPGKKERIEDQH